MGTAFKKLLVDASKEEMLLYKSKIEHEDSLNCNRINWLWIIQGGLLAAYFTKVNGVEHSLIVKWFIIAIGCITTISIGYEIIIGEICIKQIRDAFIKDYQKISNNEKRLIIGYGSRHKHHLLHYIIRPSCIAPLVFLVSWVLIAFFINTI